MKKILEKLFAAADNHGEDSGELDHVAGDLQDLLCKSWSIMTVSQRLQLLRSNEVESLVELGARGEFDREDLIDELNDVLETMEAEVLKAGYAFEEVNGNHCWLIEAEGGEDFRTAEDAIEDAYKHLLANQKAEEASDGGDGKSHVKVVVACSNSEGAPEFHTCSVYVTAKQVEDGEHYALAIENAELNGFEGPMVAFDAQDPAAQQLGSVLVWI